jgi:hypothetical protein
MNVHIKPSWQEGVLFSVYLGFVLCFVPADIWKSLTPPRHVFQVFPNKVWAIMTRPEAKTSVKASGKQGWYLARLILRP